MPQIQTVIHQIEEGCGLRYLKFALLAMALIVLLLSYNLRGFKDMSNPEAMDTAQLARNLAKHKGYTTLFVRPFSMYLLQRAAAPTDGPADRTQIRGLHPDLANPPVYPALLACMMKLSPGFRYQQAGAVTLDIGRRHLQIWNYAGRFWIYPPDFWIGLFNQIIFLGIATVLFFFARWLFDSRVAWTAATLFVGTDLFWRFSMSGLSTMLVMLIFLLLTWCLALLEKKARENNLSQHRQMLLAAAIGVIVGAGCLTRYSFGWLMLPVLAFLVLFLGRHRVILCLTVLAVFAAVIGPWLARNYHLSHAPFGTAGYAMYENTSFFPGYRLMRSLDPDLSGIHHDHLWNKLIANTRTILQEDLPDLCGSWLSAFFIVGLLVNFSNSTRSRLRYFMLLCLPLLVVAQALGRTQLSEDSPVINSENLLVLAAPLVIVFGVSLFFILLDQLNLPIPQLRHLVVGAFCFCICLPALLNFFSPRVNAVAYPPYYPPIIQKISGWMKPDELMMSDVPWAVAWYGRRECLWLTLDTQKDFADIHNHQKPIQAVYLTPVTVDTPFLGQWARAGEPGWGSFVVACLLNNEVPPDFPLKHAPTGFPAGQLFLTDADRWTVAAER